MNDATRKTRTCTLQTLDGMLRSAIRAHAVQFELTDIETEILMCCETLTIHSKKRPQRGILTTLSAVYVTPKWLVWAESSDRNDASAETALLDQIDIYDSWEMTQYAIAPRQGSNISGRYTDGTKTGIRFIVLDAEPNGEKFRQVLVKALRNAAR
jgi:hypothetical protein